MSCDSPDDAAAGFTTPVAAPIAASKLASRFKGVPMLVSLGVQTRHLLASGLCGVMFPVVARLSWRRGVLTVVWITPDSVKGAPSVFEP